MNRVEIAKNYFKKGYNCSQAVVASFSDVIGVSESQALKMASSFGSGIAKMGEVCGAVSGMLMVLGFIYGYDEAGHKKEHYELTQKLVSRFKERTDTIVCRDLIKKVPCTNLVSYAVEILERYIDENN